MTVGYERRSITLSPPPPVPSQRPLPDEFGRTPVLRVAPPRTSNGISVASVEASGATPSLTRRQTEVLCLVATGASNRVVGEQLGICEQTVKNHLCEAMRKLEADGRIQAVVEAMRLGIIAVAIDSGSSFVAIPIAPPDADEALPQQSE